MRVAISFVGLLLLPCVFGCEGNSPRRSPFAATSTPTAAKKVEYAPTSNNAAPANRPAGQANPGNPAEANPAVNPNVAPPAAGKITINAAKLAERRQQTQFHSAMFLRQEVPDVTAGTVEQNINFVTRAQQGLDFALLRQAIPIYRAEHNGKPPQSVAAFLKFLADQNIGLKQLEENEFYIYDAELAELEASRENLDFLSQFTP